MSNLSPDDIIWRTPLLHPPKSPQTDPHYYSNISNSNTSNSNSNNNLETQVGIRCIEMAGGVSLDWKIIVSEKTVPDGKQEVRVRNPKLSAAISQPLLPPMALENNSSSPTTTIAAASGGGGAKVHFQSTCLSLCVVLLPFATASSSSGNHKLHHQLWAGWSSGHISVHSLDDNNKNGGGNCGEILDCFVACRGGPIRILKSMSSEMSSSSSTSSSTNNSFSFEEDSSSSLGSESVLSKLVLSASSDFSVTLWDSRSMRMLKTVNLGASIGIIRSCLFNRFSLFCSDLSSSSSVSGNEVSAATNSSSSSPMLMKSSVAIIGADNGNLLAIDLKKEIILSDLNDKTSNSQTSSSFSNGGVTLLHQRTSVTSLLACHFGGDSSPSIIISGSEGGVIRCQTLALRSSSTSSSSTTATISLQHGSINALAILPTSSLPQQQNLVLAATSSNRIFIMMLGNNINNNKSSPDMMIPLLSTLCSFSSPTGQVTQFLSRPGWCRAVYAVTNTGAVDLYSSTEAVLSPISSFSLGTKNQNNNINDPFSVLHPSSSSKQQQQQQQAYVVAPSQLKSKAMSLIMQSERRYEQNLQLLLDLASESKMHCQDRDGKIVKLEQENREKDKVLEVITAQCESLTKTLEQLRSENSRLNTERSVIMDHANDAVTGGTQLKNQAEEMAQQLHVTNERDANSSALLDSMRMRVISLERDLERSWISSKQLEQDVQHEREKSVELTKALVQSNERNRIRLTSSSQNNFAPASASAISSSSSPTAIQSQQQQQELQQHQLLDAVLDLQRQSSPPSHY